MQTLPSSLPPSSLNQDIYTDLSSFSRMRKEAQNNPEKTLKTVARQFESLFMQMMLKSMRDASFGDPVFDTSQSRFYQDMFDKQLSLNLSQGRGIGLAEMLEKQLHGSLHKPAVSTPVPPADSPAVKDSKRKLIMPVLGVASEASQKIKSQKRKLTMPVLGLVNEASQKIKSQKRKLTMPVLGSANEASQKIKSQKRKLIMPVLGAANEVSQKIKSRSVPDESMPAYFSSPQDFVQKLMPLAQKAAGKLGVKPEVLLAQAALETGWGQHISRHADGSSSHNLFNIKAGADWDGDRVAIRTLEYRHGLARHERAAFRAYDNYADSFSDYVDFLQSAPRYQSALERVDDPSTFIRELHGAGYATDPDYADKIIDIMQRPMLQAAIKDGTRHAG